VLSSQKKVGTSATAEAAAIRDPVRDGIAEVEISEA